MDRVDRIRLRKLTMPTAEPRSGDPEVQELSGQTDPVAECHDDRPPLEDRMAMDDRAELESPANPGEALRAAREARGLTIEDLTRTTKIGGPILIALEHGDVHKLPATIFTRGFLKAYAKEVGLDPDETADLYLARLAPETLAVDGETARLNVARPAHRTEVLAYDDDISKFLADRQMGRAGGLVTAAAAVGLVVYIWSFTWNDRTAPDPTAESPAATDVATAAGNAPGGPDATRAAIETPVGPLQFQLKPHGPCWLAAAVDGNPVFARLLQAGDEENIEVHDELVLRVGDPSALTFSINGRPGRILGQSGEPVNVRITKENFREFLSS